MRKVITSAPGKLLLLGDHAVVYGFPCLVTAVDERLFVSVETISALQLRVNAPDLQIKNYVKDHNQLGTPPLPKGIQFIEKLYHIFLSKYPQTSGVSITTQSDFSNLYGFGSSSAVTVAFAYALDQLYDLHLTQKKIFDLCYDAVLAVQGVGSGFDIAAAIWGGTLYFQNAAEVITPLQVPNLPLVVGYSGTKADTSTLVRKVHALYQTHPQQTEKTFEQMGTLVEQAMVHLVAQSFMEAGKIMNQAQLLLSQLGVSSEQLDSMNVAALHAGAWGAKLSGAGGGDCMIALTDPQNHTTVVAAIEAVGGRCLPVTTQAPGVRIEKEIHVKNHR